MRALASFVLMACAMAAPAVAVQEFGAARVSAVVSVHDADTFRADIDGWPPIVGLGISVRVAGIDAPELRGKCQGEIALALEARRFAVSRLLSGAPVTLTKIRRDKYFRLLADVLIGEEDLGRSLMAAGLARPYDGGKKAGWCP